MSRAIQQWQTWVFSVGHRFKQSWENYLRSKAPYIPHSLPQRRSKAVEAVLSDIHFQESLESFVSSSGLSILEVEKKARSYLTEIASDMSYFIFPLWIKFLGWIFSHFYEDIEINKKDLETIRKMAGEKPIIFVPNHRSHMDYLMISYLLYLEQLPMPYICAGINLSFWPMGTIFRKSGAFFIRRAFDGNQLYQKSLQAYLNYLLKKNSFMEFFLEGTRSRTGKLLPPKKGVLSLLLENYQEGGHEDVVFIPTSFVYQSVIEEKSYIDEQEGGSKTRESLVGLIKLRKLLGRKYGKVYVRFDEAVSLKNFENLNVDTLAQRLTYGINRSTVVTPTALVAQALLIHPRKMILRSEIETHVEEALNYLRYKGCPLSSSLQDGWKRTMQESIAHLVDTRQLSQYKDEDGVFFHINQSRLKALDYYKNTSIHFFVSIAAVSSLLISQKDRTLTFAKLETQYGFLQKIFLDEFAFSQRSELKDHLTKVLNYLENEKWITVDQDTIHVDEVGTDILHQYHRILLSYYDAYYAVWTAMGHLKNKNTEKKETEHYLLNRAHLQFLRETIQQPEAINKNLIQNVIHAFTQLELIHAECRGIGKQKKIYYHFTLNENLYQSIGDLLRQLMTLH